MMPRWVWWAPLAVFLLWWAWLGFRWGWIAMTTTETDVIEAYAERYLADRARDGSADGAELSDCVAYPGADRGVWLHVVCGPASGDPARTYDYRVNRLGGLVPGGMPRSARSLPGRPET
jgi:hypothetical protein